MPDPGKKKPAKKDILIPVMGATGAGKSTFINTLLGEEEMQVGRGLQSCTIELAFGSIEKIEGHPLLQGYRIVLIDTPGFDDTYKTDFVILSKIATWLKNSYKKGAKLGGVIYLHDISAARFTGTARRNLQMFRSLCGEDVLDNIVLGTTKWALNVPDSDLRHSQLTADYWEPLLAKGATAFRIEDTYESAWRVIERIISPSAQKTLNDTVLLIQREMVDKKKIIPETQAGQELRFTLQEVLDIHKKLLRLDAREDNEDLQAQRREAQEKVKLLVSQIQKLRIPLRRQLRKLFSFLNLS